MIALVDNRSWTKSGSVGTSNDNRSAFPAQFRKGSLFAVSFTAAAWAVSIVFGFVDLPDQRLSVFARRVLAVPVERRREGGVVLVGHRRFLLLELRLRPHIRSQEALGL